MNMGTYRSQPGLRWSLLALFSFLIAAAAAEALNARQRTLRKSNRTSRSHKLVPDPIIGFSDNQEDTIPHTLDSRWGFVELFKKLFGGGAGGGEEEAPTTSEQRRSSWQEEERHAEFAFCTDAGFRGVHPEEGGEET